MRRLFIFVFTLVLVMTVIATAQTSPAAGEWDVAMNTPGGVRNFKAVLKVSGENLTGEIKRDADSLPLTGTAKGKDVQFSYTVRYNDDKLVLTFTGKIDGDTMKGTVNFGGFAEDEWSAKRVSSAVAATTTSTSSSKDATPPKIVITSPPLTRGQGVKPAADRILKQSGSSLTVTGQATDESGVREVTVRGAVVARLDEHGNFSVEVPLQVGDNPITVTATDNSGNRATESFTVRYEPPPVTGRYFALVIGNNRYPNLPAERQLRTAVNDAQQVAALLRTEYGFQTKLLTDVKRAEIINALNEYRRSLKADDNLLIYYAGHGHFDEETKKAYWIPVDAELGSPANWIIADDVTSTIRAIPSRHILIVSDSCYSGTLTRATDFRLSTPAERERYLEKMRSGTSRILMASGGNEPVADGGGGNHSVFARALLDGLRGMSERVFTADELFHQFIKEQVGGKSDQTPEYNPLRNSGHESGDFVFVRVR